MSLSVGLQLRFRPLPSDANLTATNLDDKKRKKQKSARDDGAELQSRKKMQNE
jgi:hypothetical protein